MKANDYRSLFHHPHLSKSCNVNGINFQIDLKGYVSSQDFDELGHIEDCEAFSELVFALTEALSFD